MAKSMVNFEPSQSDNLCPNCKGIDSIFDSHRGELICSGCGLVLRSRIINCGPEWRAFDSEQRDQEHV